MPGIAQEPGVLDITLKKGDTFSIDLDFDVDLTDYVLESKMGTTPITITDIETTDGQINLSLSSTQTATFNTLKKTTWYLKWTDPGTAVRMVLYGDVTLT